MSRTLTAYDSTFFPPIPVLEVSFSSPEDRNTSPFYAAILDTGADMTIVPKEILLELGAPSLFDAQLRSSWGEPHPVIIYLIDLRIGEIKLSAIQVAADEFTNEVVLGRNVLNKLPVLIDGPERITEVLDDASIRRMRSRRASQ